MTKSRKPTPPPCPVTYALEIFGDRWTLLVLKDLILEARYRYKDLMAANSGLATNVLADRLKRLEQRGLIEKTRDPQDGRQFVYLPTGTAIGLIPMLVEMIAWSARQGVSQVPPEFLERIERDRAGLIADLTEQVERNLEAHRAIGG